jgi:hypothetical protein
MTRDEVQATKRGLYRVFWKVEVGGGSSLASVGSTPSGTRWLAPCNWVGFESTTDQAHLDETWDHVERLEMIAEVD